ncbi:MAG: AAA family ATPase [Magnetococcales bacterium]|nr:AAA family ATPase [Magnetococcales bacterium]
MSNLIFVCGISGVGKTFLLNAASKTLLDVQYLSAGKLAQKIEHEQDPNLRQLELGKMLARYRVSGSTLIVDGHLVFPKEGGFFDVPLDAVAALHPNAIIVVVDDCQMIANRRKNDQVRGRETIATPHLKKWQDREICLAIDYAKRLGIPSQTISARDTERFINVLELFAPHKGTGRLIEHEFQLTCAINTIDNRG